ncbi:MAG: ParA family protein [Synergistaceae bacterium]|nr:ParA family protein [Synergistaceae bacterium]
MITIGFCNLKGGVGKTTACQNIAVALAKMGRKVAVVDMDPQSNLSAGFGVTPSETEAQVFDLLSGGASWDDIIRRKENVDIIPSCLNLAMAELNNQSPVNSNEALRDALKQVEPDRYDFILLDSPPQLGVFTRNVLCASDKIIVPMDGGFYSLFGLRLLSDAMPVLRERLNPKLEICGILMTNYNPRLSIVRQVFEEVGKSFGDVLFRNCIRQNVSLVEASSMGMSIFEYSPKSKGAECYHDAAQELLGKLSSGRAPSSAKIETHDVPKREPVRRAIKTPEPEPIATIPEPDPEPEPVIPPEIPEPEPEAITPQETPEPEPVELEKAPEIEPELEIAPEDIAAALQEAPEPPVPVPEEPEQPKPPVQYTQKTLGDYEEGIKQSVLGMLPEKHRAMWRQILGNVNDISRGEIDAGTLRDDFEDCDKERYKFYVLNDERDSFWPVAYSDQIIDPMRCVLKMDEYEGSAEVFITYE